MKKIGRTRLPFQEVQSLIWDGDTLVDWVAGGRSCRLDGTTRDPHVSHGFRFNAAVSSPSGRYSVIYDRLGTKGLVLREGEFLREINRSYYHASAYEYPVALFAFPDGRECLAHCPDEYCKLEIEEVETGRPLTHRDNKPRDLFHSRLDVSPDGRWLLSAGWVWHPVDCVWIYDIPAALQSPPRLDEPEDLDLVVKCGVEAGSACFTGPDTVAVSSGPPIDEPDEDGDEGHGLEEMSIGVYDLRSRRYTHLNGVDEVVGNMLPFGEFVVGLHEHPKLIDLRTGKITHRWTEFNSGRHNSSIIHHLAPAPPIACDSPNRRFAIADPGGITVIQLG